MTVSIHIDEKHLNSTDYLDGILKKAKVKIASFTDIDPLFEFAGVDEGVEIWRVENLKLVSVDKSLYGFFYEGDCYVVLVTTATQSGKIVWDLHYWKGSKASVDKAFVCAIKACELHRQLRHQSHQYREVQGQESDLFKQYFTKITIVKGGTPSALKIMKKVPLIPRLFQVKGPKNQVVVKQVNAHYSSLNSGDIFVLETEDVIIQWSGKQCNLCERATALEFTTHLKLFRPKVKQVEYLYEGYNETNAFFWQTLKGKPRTMKSRSEGGSDTAYVGSTIMDLYSIHESKNTGVQISLVETRFMPTPKRSTIRPLSKNASSSQVQQIPLKVRNFANLKQDSMYLLDCDLSLFLWYGKRASSAARTLARGMAEESILKFNRPNWVPIIKVLPPVPAPEFWINFSDRHQNCVVPVFGPDESIQTISMPQPINIVNAQKKLALPPVPPRAAPQLIFEDTPGQGELLIWRVDKIAMVQVPKGNEGLFNSGYSYIIIYSHWHKKSLCHMVYYWEGKNRPCGSWLTWKWDLSPQLISGLQQATGGIPPTCARLVQGQETPQFFELFSSLQQQKQLIIFNALLPAYGPKLFVVCGFEEKRIVGKEVKCCASTLSSGQASVLLCEDTIYIWCGLYANAAERRVAERVCERLRVCEKISSEAIVRVEEGHEPGEFWDAIGGKQKYWKFNDREGHHRTATPNPHPRVFRCVHSEKTLVLEEMTQYSDQDLEERETFILLAYGKVYLWRGVKVTTYEENVACALVGRHLEQTNISRVDFLKERSGAESLAFRCLFGKWDAPRILDDPYKSKMEALYELGVIGREVPMQPRTSYPLKSIEERSWWLRPTHVPR